MSTEYQLYLNHQCDLRALAAELVEKLRHLGTLGNQSCTPVGAGFSVGSQFAGFSVRCPSGPKLAVLEEEYGIKAKVVVSAQTYNEVGYPAPQIHLMQLVDAFLRDNDADLLLEFNGESMILLRRGGEVEINHAFDDGNRFPFHVLSLPYRVVPRPLV